MSDLRMPDLNRVIIAGNLTRDPELRMLPSGVAVCKLGLAQSRKFRSKDGSDREDKLYINATCWDKTAQFAGDYLKKGRPVLIEGRLQMNEWDDKATGQKRSTIEIKVDRLELMDWEDRGGRSAGGGSRPQKQESAPEGPEPEDDIPF